MLYTDLIFDLYGTLVDIHTEESDQVWEKTAIYFGFFGAHFSGSTLKEAFRSSVTRREAAAGQSYECFPDIPFEEIMTELFQSKGVADASGALGVQAAQLFRVLSIDYIRLYPHVLRALDALKKKGCRLWLLSNAQRIFTAYELRHLGLGEQFDRIYISSDYGCRKPDRRFIGTLLREQKLNPQNCLMIGNDRDTDIAGAKAAGLATFYMHTELTPREQTAASPALLPGIAGKGCRHFEFEGDNWREILKALLKVID